MPSNQIITVDAGRKEGEEDDEEENLAQNLLIDRAVKSLLCLPPPPLSFANFSVVHCK